MNRTGLNSTANSGPSVGASSLVTDANSALSGGPHLQRSTSINTESYMRLPASPMSFSSNNISISGSSVIDGSSIVQQNSHQAHSPQQMQQRPQGTSTATSQPTSRTSHIPLSSTLSQEASYLSQMQKKPRLDIRQEDVLQHPAIQQLLQRPDPGQLQGHNQQMQALIQQQRFFQRQQQPQNFMQSLPPMQRAQLQHQLQQQQQQQQLRQQVQQQGIQPAPAVKQSYQNGVCARRLMQFLYHQRHRPPDNTIVYWRKFVAEYFSPRAKKRWCLSLYDNVGQHALGVFPQATMEAWQCDICTSKSGRGFEATFEVLPRLNKVKFDSGIVDDLLFLDMPRECRFPSGVMMLEYGKAVQESIYEQLRVVREGKLRIMYAPDLKILSWEFCARRHEEFLPRRLVAPQVNQLLQVSQKHQNTVMESGSAGPSVQDLQDNCNMFLSAGRQLVKNMELQTLNDLGFSKRYVRCLQISEVVNSMKDLIDFSREQKVGPIESLKNYPRQSSAAKIQMQKMQEIEQQASGQTLSNDHSTLNKVMGMQPGLGTQTNNNNHLVGSGLLNPSAQNAVALNNYQNLLRQNSMNANPIGIQHDASSFNSPIQAQSAPYQGAISSSQVPSQNGPVNESASPQQIHQQHSPMDGILQHAHHPQSSQGNPNMRQHMIQQLLQEMMTNNGGGRVQQQPQPQPQPQQQQQQTQQHQLQLQQQRQLQHTQQLHQQQHANGTMLHDTPDAANGTANGGFSVKAASTGGMVANGVGFGNHESASVNSMSADMGGGMPTRSNSLRGNLNVNSAVGGNDNFSLKDQDVLQNLHLPEIVQDISNEFPDWDV